MEWVNVLVDIVLFAFVTVCGFVGRKYLIPWIQDAHLESVAAIVVNAAEALYGAGHGDEKLNYCLTAINQEYGITIDAAKVRLAIEAAWNALNISQIAAGEKVAE